MILPAADCKSAGLEDAAHIHQCRLGEWERHLDRKPDDFFLLDCTAVCPSLVQSLLQDMTCSLYCRFASRHWQCCKDSL